MNFVGKAVALGAILTNGIPVGPSTHVTASPDAANSIGESIGALTIRPPLTIHHEKFADTPEPADLWPIAAATSGTGNGSAGLVNGDDEESNPSPLLPLALIGAGVALCCALNRARGAIEQRANEATQRVREAMQRGAGPGELSGIAGQLGL